VQRQGQRVCRRAVAVNTPPSRNKTRQSYQVCGDNSVQRFRLKYHATCHSIHKHLVALDIWEVFGDLCCDLIPQHHPVPLRVALGDHSQELPWSLLRDLKGEADQSFDTMAGKYGDFRCSLPWLATMRSTSLTCVFTFRVLANDHPVQIAMLGFPEW